MTPDQPSTGIDPDRAKALQDMPPVPDEDGPHDVPDEAVIEATLPTVPVSDLP